MSDMKHGGAAFPLQSIGVDFMPGHHGMTLRDYFAGQALAGLCANPDPADIFDAAQGRSGVSLSLSQIIYEIADAMLRQREADQ